MSVFVDDYRAPCRGMIMSHMMADTTLELLEMADKLGIRREHIQAAGKWKEHFDVSQKMRRRAIAFGAVPLTARAMSRRFKDRGAPA